MCVLTQGDKHAAISTLRLSKREGGMVTRAKLTIRPVPEIEGQLPNCKCPKRHSEFDIVI